MTSSVTSLERCEYKSDVNTLNVQDRIKKYDCYFYFNSFVRLHRSISWLIKMFICNYFHIHKNQKLSQRWTINHQTWTQLNSEFKHFLTDWWLIREQSAHINQSLCSAGLSLYVHEGQTPSHCIYRNTHLNQNWISCKGMYWLNFKVPLWPDHCRTQEKKVFGYLLFSLH